MTFVGICKENKHLENICSPGSPCSTTVSLLWCCFITHLNPQQPQQYGYCTLHFHNIFDWLCNPTYHRLEINGKSKHNGVIFCNYFLFLNTFSYLLSSHSLYLSAGSIINLQGLETLPEMSYPSQQRCQQVMTAETSELAAKQQCVGEQLCQERKTPKQDMHHKDRGEKNQCWNI